MRKIHGIGLIFLVVLIYACSLSPLPALKQFSINSPIVKIKPVVINGKVSLKVEKYLCPSLYENLFIYRVNNYQFEPYSNASWLNPVCDMFGDELKNALSNAGFEVLEYGRPKYTILFSVNKFYLENSKAVACVKFWVKKSNDCLLKFKICKFKIVRSDTVTSTVNSLGNISSIIVQKAVYKIVTILKKQERGSP